MSCLSSPRHDPGIGGGDRHDQFVRADQKPDVAHPSTFSGSHGKPRGGDRPVISGIIEVIRYGLEWKGAPSGYGRARRFRITLCDGAGAGLLPRLSPLWRARPTRPHSL